MQKTRQQLIQMVNARFPDNNQRLITAADAREAFFDIIDSFGNIMAGEVAVFPSSTPNVNVPVGNLPNNYVLANKSVVQVNTDMLTKFLEPNIVVSIAPSQSVQGSTVTSLTVGWTIQPGNDELLGMEVFIGGVSRATPAPASGSQAFNLVDADTGYPGMRAIDSVGLRTVTIVADWNDRGTRQYSRQVIFPAPFYAGAGADADAYDTLPQQALETDGTRSNVSFTTNNNKYIIARLKSFGALAGVIDANGFDFKGGFLAPVEKVKTFADGSQATYYVFVYGSNVIPGTKVFTIL